MRRKPEVFGMLCIPCRLYCFGSFASGAGEACPGKNVAIKRLFSRSALVPSSFTCSHIRRLRNFTRADCCERKNREIPPRNSTSVTNEVLDLLGSSRPHMRMGQIDSLLAIRYSNFGIAARHCALHWLDSNLSHAAVSASMQKSSHFSTFGALTTKQIHLACGHQHLARTSYIFWRLVSTT